MTYDNTCKFLAETYPADFATWLLGAPVPLALLDPKELSSEPIRADSLILFESDERVLHIEFQTEPESQIPLRMADYRLRIHRRHPSKEIIQVVVYLTRSGSPLVQQTVYEFTGHRSEYRVIRMWEQPSGMFLSAPGLYPLAVLSQTANRKQLLRQVGQAIEQLPDPQQRRQVTSSTAILAGLVLGEETIRQILPEEIMRESSMVQSWLAEGRAEARAELTTQIALNFLRDGIDPQVVARNTGLSLEEIQQLQAQIAEE